MSVEEQVTGTRYAGKVQGWAYHGGSDPEFQTIVAVVLESGDGETHRLTVPMLVAEAAKVRRGDNVCVTVEITREPE